MIACRCRILVLVCDDCLKLLRAPPQLSYKTSGKGSNNSSSGSHSLGDMEKNLSSEESNSVGIAPTPPRSEEHPTAEVAISIPEVVKDGGSSRCRGKREAATVKGVPVVSKALPYLVHGSVLMCSACARGSRS